MLRHFYDKTTNVTIINILMFLLSLNRFCRHVFTSIWEQDFLNNHHSNVRNNIEKDKLNF